MSTTEFAQVAASIIVGAWIGLAVAFVFFVCPALLIFKLIERRRAHLGKKR